MGADQGSWDNFNRFRMNEQFFFEIKSPTVENTSTIPPTSPQLK